MRRGRLIVIGSMLVVAAVVAICCSPFVSDTDQRAEPDAAPRVLPDTGADVGPTGSSGDAAVDAGGGCPSGCPGTAGPCAVRVGTTCIDSTEVTVAHYRVFVEAGVTIDAGPPCTTPIQPTLGAVPDDRLPMTSVDYCEARAYCVWAGKQLCGKVGGGPLAVDEQTTQVSAWFNACTGGAGVGPSLISDGGCRLAADASRPGGSGCEGSVAGLFDMVGNVWEWVDVPHIARDGEAPSSFFLGGGYGHPLDSNCKTTSGSLIDFHGVDVGFRCCSP